MLRVGDLGVHGVHVVAHVSEEFEIGTAFVMLHLQNMEQNFVR